MPFAQFSFSEKDACKCTSPEHKCTLPIEIATCQQHDSHTLVSPMPWPFLLVACLVDQDVTGDHKDQHAMQACPKHDTPRAL
jgi:hypothetical protein